MPNCEHTHILICNECENSFKEDFENCPCCGSCELSEGGCNECEEGEVWTL